MGSIEQALVIMAFGMGLVFASIFLLWGMMALIVRLTGRMALAEEAAAAGQAGEEEENEEAQEQEIAPGRRTRTSKQKAAAIAVAVALAREKSLAAANGRRTLGLSNGHNGRETDKSPQPPNVPALPPTASVSAWQAVMRGNHLSQKRPRR